MLVRTLDTYHVLAGYYSRIKSTYTGSRHDFTTLPPLVFPYTLSTLEPRVRPSFHRKQICHGTNGILARGTVSSSVVDPDPAIVVSSFKTSRLSSSGLCAPSNVDATPEWTCLGYIFQNPILGRHLQLLSTIVGPTCAPHAISPIADLHFLVEVSCTPNFFTCMQTQSPRRTSINCTATMICAVSIQGPRFFLALIPSCKVWAAKNRRKSLYTERPNKGLSHDLQYVGFARKDSGADSDT